MYRQLPFKRQVPTCSTTVCRYGSVCRERKRIRFADPSESGTGPAVEVREEIIGTECHCDYDCLGLPERPTCASDYRLYGSLCEVRKTSCLFKRDLRPLPLVLCSNSKGSLPSWVSSFFVNPMREAMSKL